MDESTINSIYNQDYYGAYGHNKQPYATNYAVFRTLERLTRFLGIVQFKTHLDVGCALGVLVKTMRAKGKWSWGFDASDYAIDNAIVESTRYIWKDNILNPDILANIESHTGLKSFDLVTCVEIIEHLDPKDEGAAIDFLCSLSDNIYFSSANDREDRTHFNAHESSYWSQRFLERGYVSNPSTFPDIPWGRIYTRAESYKELSALLDRQTRVEVLLRDDLKCAICGKQGVQVHEIVPRSAFGKKTMHDCFAIKNRVCLCPEHHADAHTVKYRKMLIKLLAAKYEYTYTEQFYQKYTEN